MSGFRKEPVYTATVDALGVLQKRHIRASFFAQSDESLNVFRQAKSSKSEARTQKLRSDARVEPHGLDYFVDISTHVLADIGNQVRI